MNQEVDDLFFENLVRELLVNLDELVFYYKGEVVELKDLAKISPYELTVKRKL